MKPKLTRPASGRLLPPSLLAATLLAGAVTLAAPVEGPLVEQVFNRLRTELPALEPPAPGQTNVGGYLASLAPLVLVERQGGSDGPRLARTNVYGPGFGYLRIARVEAGVVEDLEAALNGMGRGRPLKGVVLDLRFAGGADYASAAGAAGRFATREGIQVRLGTETWPVQPRGGTSAPPTMVLVNRQSRGAAEALAAAVRASAPTALVLGSNTAGEARVYRSVELGHGLVARVAGDALTLPSGESIQPGGLEPDVQVAAAEADERSYLTNEFRRPDSGSGGRANGLARLNEAELVRRRANHRPAETHPREREPAVQDPVLGCALDLLESLVSSPPEAGPEGDSR